MLVNSKLKRNLTFFDLIAYGLIFIGPSAAVGIFGTLYAKSNGAIALIYIIATLTMSITAISYWQMSVAVPKAGSVYAYVTAGLNSNILGFLTGWMILLDYLFIPAVAYLFTGIALNSFIHQIPPWVFTLVAVIITTGLNLRGIKTVAIVVKVVLISGIVILSLVLICGSLFLFQHGALRPLLSPLTGVSQLTVHNLLAPVSIAVLSFLGFDAIATFAEENSGNKNNIGLAIMVCLIIAGSFFVLQTYIGALIYQYPPDYLIQHPELQGKAYYELIRHSLSPFLATSLALIKAVGASFSAMVAIAASSRLIYSIANDGVFSKQLSKTSEGSGTPIPAMLASSLVTMIVAVWAATEDNGLDILVSLVDMGALSAFLMLHCSVIGLYLFQNKSKRWFIHGIAPLLGIISMVGVIVYSSGVAQLIGLAWLVLGVVIILIRRKKTINEC